MGLTPCMLCVQIHCVLCVLDYYLLSQDRAGLCFWKPLCLLSTPEDLATINYQRE